MLSRLQHEQKGLRLPDQWHQETLELLNSVYSDKLGNRSFYIFGQTFSTELFLAVSMVNKDNPSIMPVTFSLSALIEANQDSTKLLPSMIDLMGMFLDGYFATPDWNEYTAVWTETEFKKQTFFYQVTREDIALTLEANTLLGD